MSNDMEVNTLAKHFSLNGIQTIALEIVYEKNWLFICDYKPTPSESNSYSLIIKN